MPLIRNRVLRSSTRCVLLVVLSVAATSCTSKPAGPSWATSSPSSPTTTDQRPTVSPSPASITIRFGDAGTATSDGYGGAFAATDIYVARSDPADLHGVEVIRLADHAVVLRHRPADEKIFDTTFVGISGYHLVVLDEDVVDDDSMGVGSSKRPDIGYIYDLSTDKQTPIADVRSAPTISPYGQQGGFDAAGNWYYSAQTKGKFANCVGMLNLKTLQGKIVQCAPDKGVIYYVHPSDGGVSWTTFLGAGFSSCRAGHGIRDGRLFLIGPANDCSIFDAVAVDGWNVWSDQSRTVLQPYIPLNAANGTDTVQLADIRPMSLKVCGGYAYWVTGAAVGGSLDSLVRWRPGDATSTTVLAATDVDGSEAAAETIYPVGCNNNILTVVAWRYFTTIDRFTAQVLTLAP